MDGTTYTAEVMRTYAGSHDLQEQLTLAALGLTGEAGEVADHVKKAFFHGHLMDRNHLIKELGDVLWYLVLACDAVGSTLEEVMQRNVEKLRQRYPHGFDAERSMHRNVYEPAQNNDTCLIDQLKALDGQTRIAIATELLEGRK